MFELQVCRICLNNNVRLHQISGSEVQDVYEKLTNNVQEDGNLYFACYICYCQLRNFQLLGRKIKKSKQLLQQIPISEFYLRPISCLDRHANGLVHSLMVTNIQSLQIPESNEFIKTEKQDENDTNEEIFRDSSDVEFGAAATPLKKQWLGENYNIKHSNDNSIESGEKEIIIKIETITATYSNNLSRIVKDEKRTQVLTKKTFICNDCGKDCETKAVLIKHISGHKPVAIEVNETNLENCKYFSEKYKSEIKEKDSSNKNLRYKCKYCNYTCAVSSNFKVHIRTHTGEKPFKCQYCTYTCTEKSRLKRHIRSHTGEKPFKCQYCSYTCTINSNLKIHIRTHTGEKPFKCQYCSYTCTQNGRLKNHIRTHTGEKPHKCQYCSFTCTVNSRLKRHIRTHTGEKPYKCQYCSFTCTQNSNLKNHIKIHTGEKPFKCQYCSFTCTINSNLKIHIRTHTGEKPFKCKYCSYTCTQNGSLKNHIRTHTGETV